MANEIDQANELTAIMRGLAEPLAKAQETQAREASRQVETKEMQATLRERQGYFFGGGVLLLVAAMSMLCLFTGRDDLAEKLIGAAIVFAGGFGAGRASK